MLRTFAFFILAASPPAFASYADGAAVNPPDHIVLCERILNPPAGAIQQIDNALFGRPLILFDVHNMTGKGLVRMGLDPNSSKRSLQDLVLIVERNQSGDSLVVKLNRWANQSFKTVQRLEFHPQWPKGYRTLGLNTSQLRLSFDQLQQQFPEGQSDSRDHGIGWQTEPDRDGVRRYLQFHEDHLGEFIAKYVKLGIDVPADTRTARIYSPDVDELTEDLRTPERNYRRIGVLTFARFEDD